MHDHEEVQGGAETRETEEVLAAGVLWIVQQPAGRQLTRAGNPSEGPLQLATGLSQCQPPNVRGQLQANAITRA